MRIHIIAAISRNGIIGVDGEIPWHLPEDLKRFKALTTKHAIIMGRKTWESIGRPLPHRFNVVLSRQADLELPESVALAENFAAALSLCHEKKFADVFAIGGEAVYAVALPLADTMHLTHVDREVTGDARFPTWDKAAWTITHEEKHDGFSYIDYARKGSQ